MKTKTILCLGLAFLLNSRGITAATLQSNIRHPLSSNTIANSRTESKLQSSYEVENVPGDAMAWFRSDLVPRSEQWFNIDYLHIDNSVTIVQLHGNISHFQKLQSLNIHGNLMKKAALNITGAPFARWLQGGLDIVTLIYPFQRMEITGKGIPLVRLEFEDHMERPLDYLHLGAGQQHISAMFILPESYLKGDIVWVFEASVRMWDEEKDEPGLYLFSFEIMHFFQ
ncbi:hypothetical protein V8F06_001795 [Rhypophila decipiens]